MQTIIDKFFKKNWQITLVVLLAFVLRISLITINPPSLNWDEVSHGYNAYSIIKTGRDEWGELLPAIFRAYGDYKLPVYIYLTSISIAAFGLNAFAVRLPSVIAGVVTVVFTYLVTLELFKKKKKQSSFNPGHLALLSALLVAIEPWSFFLSRGAFEANVALSFIVAGIYYFLKGTKSSRYLPAAAILLGLSVWTYNSARIIVPVFTTLLMFLYRFEIKEMYRKSSKYLKISVAVALLLFLPMLWQLINPVGQARYSWVSIIDEGAIAQINEARNTSNLNETVKVALYNKGTYFVKEFVSNWASHFSGEFLFTRGGSHYQFSVPGHGLIFSINAILLLGGIIFLLKKKDRRAFVILGWFYLGSIASSLTREAPHVLRSITILPAPMILTSYGAIKAFSWLRKRSKVILKLFVLFYMFILVLYFGRYLKEYFNNYRVEYSWSWQYGYGQMVDYLKNYYQDYDKIVVT
ncbi:MAG: glycosyltransferase family 39 protein, partial [Candidatus Woesebacteria bacterium]